MLPSPSASYGPPKAAELALSREALAIAKNRPFDLYKGFLSIIIARQSFNLETLRSELAVVGGYLRDLITPPFLADRNELAFKRFPAVWLNNFTGLRELGKFPEVVAFIDILNNPEWCKRKRYESPVQGEIVMCEFQGVKKELLALHLEASTKVIDLCSSFGVFSNYLYQIRTKMSWQVGDRFSPATHQFHDQDQVTIEDIWGVTFSLTYNGKTDDFTLSSVSGEHSNIYRLSELPREHVRLLIASRGSLGEKIKDVPLSSHETSTPTTMADLSRVAGQDAPVCCLVFDGDVVKLTGDMPRIFLPTKITIEPKEPAQSLLHRAYRNRELAASKMLLGRLQFKGQEDDTSTICRAERRFNSFKLIVHKREIEGIFQMTLRQDQEGHGALLYKDSEGTFSYSLIKEGSQWRSLNKRKIPYQEWVHSLEQLVTLV